LSVSLIILLAAPAVLFESFFLLSISGKMRASALNCSMLNRTSLILSLVTFYWLETHWLTRVKSLFFWLALQMFLMMLSALARLTLSI
jgi:hypothetical protein